MQSLMNKLTGRSSSKDNTNLNSSNAYANTNTNSSVLANNQSGYNHPTDVNVPAGNTQNKAAYLEQTNGANNSLGISGNSTTGTNLATTTGSTMNTVETVGVTRSEERLVVGKEKLDTGAVGINKYVTSEHVEEAVPIVKEHVVIEREPIMNRDTINNNGMNPEIGESRFEINTTAERAIGLKETVPIEKIRISKVEEHTQDVIAADLRKEHIDVIDNTNEKVLRDINNNNNNTVNAPGTTI